MVTGGVDYIVSDLPFGNTHKRDDAIIPMVLEEMARLLKPLGSCELSDRGGSSMRGGRAVLLVQKPGPLLEHLERSAAGTGGMWWSRVETRPTIIGGLCCTVLTLWRGPRPFA